MSLTWGYVSLPCPFRVWCSGITHMQSGKSNPPTGWQYTWWTDWSTGSLVSVLMCFYNSCWGQVCSAVCVWTAAQSQQRHQYVLTTYSPIHIIMLQLFFTKRSQMNCLCVSSWTWWAQANGWHCCEWEKCWSLHLQRLPLAQIQWRQDLCALRHRQPLL